MALPPNPIRYLNIHHEVLNVPSIEGVQVIPNRVYLNLLRLVAKPDGRLVAKPDDRVRQ